MEVVIFVNGSAYRVVEQASIDFIKSISEDNTKCLLMEIVK